MECTRSARVGKINRSTMPPGRWLAGGLRTCGTERDPQHLEHEIAQRNVELENALRETNLKLKISRILEYLEFLKYLILSNQPFEVKEDIYKKRHFTVDIPSMYGSYHEMKFNALGLTFRLEALVNTLFEALVEDMDLSLITKAIFFEVYDRLMLFDKALKIDGIQSIELEMYLEMLAHSLEARGFTFTQYLDIFKGFAQAVKNIINDYFGNIHGKNLTEILSRLPFDQISPKYMPQEGISERTKVIHRISEIFYRDRIALTTPGRPPAGFP